MSIFSEKQVEEIVDLLVDYPEGTKIYLGCDSIRVFKNGEMHAKFATVAIIHKGGNNGCRIFSDVSFERDYDVKANRPKVRMLNEVRKVCELYHELIPFIDGYEIEIHLDISTDPKRGSNCAASEAAGYVLGMTGIEPKFKPESFCASFGADHVVNKGGR